MLDVRRIHLFKFESIDLDGLAELLNVYNRQNIID